MLIGYGIVIISFVEHEQQNECSIIIGFRVIAIETYSSYLIKEYQF